MAVLDLGDNLCSKRYSASDDRVGLCISLALPTLRLIITSWSGFFPKHSKVADERVLRVPSLGISVELAEEDVHAVGLAENVLRCFDVDDVLSVRAWLFGDRRYCCICC